MVGTLHPHGDAQAVVLGSPDPAAPAVAGAVVPTAAPSGVSN
jgi:hypothetical protein